MTAASRSVPRGTRPDMKEVAKLDALTRAAKQKEREEQKGKAGAPDQRAGIADWPALVQLGAPEIPRLSADLLPGWAGAYAGALASATETPPELAAGMILAAAAVPCARRFRLLVAPGHFEPCNLWIAVALAPGNRKSAVQDAACRPLVAYEREAAGQVAAERTAAESLAKTLQARASAVRAEAAKSKDEDEIDRLSKEAASLEADIRPPPVAEQLWTSDATPERLGAIMADQDECLAWLSSEAGLFDLLAGRYSRGVSNLDLVLKAWSGDAERVDRSGRPPVYLAYPRLTIGLSPQPDVLNSLSKQPGFRGRGLLARFLYLLPPSPLGYRDLGSERPGACIPGHLEAGYRAGLKAMLDWPATHDEAGRVQTYIVSLEPASHREWLAFARAIEADMRPGGNYESVTDLASKAPGMGARIAAVFHGIEHAHGRPWETPINAETMSKALAVSSVMLRHGLAAMDMMGTDSHIAAARKVWDWLERGRNRGATVRDAYQALRRTFPRVSELNNALEVLVERGYVRLADQTEPGANGRPKSPTIEVHPELLKRWL